MKFMLALVAVALCLSSGAVAYFLLNAEPQPQSDVALTPAVTTGPDLEAGMANISESVGLLREEIAALRNDNTNLRGELGRLEELVAKSVAATATGNMKGASYSAGEDPAADSASEEEKVVEFKELMEHLFSGDADWEEDTDEYARFWELARTTDLLDKVISEYEKNVDSSPADLDARMTLADSYIAKLLAVPSGPERGIWGMKAGKQWQEVATQDPDHWQAHYKMGESYSYYPAPYERTDDAIEWLEKSRAILDRQPKEENHAETFLRLSLMYGRKDNKEKSVEVLKSGIDRHPDNEALRKALEAAQKEMK